MAKAEELDQRFAAYSTFLSKAATEAFAQFLTASGCLDEALLYEAPERVPYGQVVFESWRRSVAALEEARRRIDVVRSAVDHVRNQMGRTSYEDPSILKAFDYRALKERWVDSGIIAPGPEWDEVVSLVSTTGSQVLFDRYESILDRTASKTDELLVMYRALESAARGGKLHLTIEQGREFRETFTGALTGWIVLFRMFQCAGLIYNEVHYQTCDCIER